MTRFLVNRALIWDIEINRVRPRRHTANRTWVVHPGVSPEEDHVAVIDSHHSLVIPVITKHFSSIVQPVPPWHFCLITRLIHKQPVQAVVVIAPLDAPCTLAAMVGACFFQDWVLYWYQVGFHADTSGLYQRRSLLLRLVEVQAYIQVHQVQVLQSLRRTKAKKRKLQFH